MLLKYKCNRCENSIQKYFPPGAKLAPFLECGQCGGILEKQLPDFGTTSLEVVDNGAMARKVELRKDAVERFREKGDIYIKNLEERDKVLKKDEN